MVKIPATVSDVLLHNIDSVPTENVILPITRYKNVINAPTLINDSSATNGAPFTLLVTETETLSASQLRKLIPELL
jgi:hypothetical protein